MTSQALAPYSVVAFNAAKLSENKMHDDTVAKRFGFTGGHFHKNWQNDNFRTLVLNAIAWTAKLDVPEGGVPSKTPTDEEMKANLDEKK